jgi:hypothetical protein
VEDVAGVSVLMLPLAYSIGTILNFFLLFLFFQKEFGSIAQHVKKGARQVFLISIIMGFVAYVSLGIFAGIFNLNTFFGIFLQGFLAGILALVAGFFLLKFFKNEEFEELTSSFKRKFYKKMVVKPEPEELP